jgi:hypothetical protein
MAGGHGFSGDGHAGAPAGYHSFGGGRGWGGNGWNGWRGNGWRGNGWRGNRYRIWGGYPWAYGAYAGYGYPWYGGYGWYGFDDFDYDSSDYYGPPPAQYAYGYPPRGPIVSYATQDEVQSIQNEVAQLRAEQARKYSEPIPLGTVLVFRDGRKETIQNYAIAGSTLWILDQDHARKVPLTDLNLTATKRDNEERGAEFAVPSAH